VEHPAGYHFDPGWHWRPESRGPTIKKTNAQHVLRRAKVLPDSHGRRVPPLCIRIVQPRQNLRTLAFDPVARRGRRGQSSPESHQHQENSAGASRRQRRKSSGKKNASQSYYLLRLLLAIVYFFASWPDAQTVSNSRMFDVISVLLEAPTFLSHPC